MKKEVKIAFLSKEHDFKPSPQDQVLLEALRTSLDLGKQSKNFNFGTEGYLPGIEYIFHCRDILSLGEASVEIFKALWGVKKQIKEEKFTCSIVGNQSFGEILSLGYYLNYLQDKYLSEIREIKSISVAYFPSVYPSYISVYITLKAGYILQFNIDNHCSIITITESNINRRFRTRFLRIMS